MSSSSSSSSANTNSDEQVRDWLELPSDVTTNILQRIGVVDILENAQNVCTAWRKICKDDPAVWRVIKMHIGLGLPCEKLRLKQAVDRSQGQLVDISLCFWDEELFSYVANRSRQLRRLEIICRYDTMPRRISKPLMEFPFLEELNIYSSGVCMKKSVIETAGRYCLMLKTLKLNQKPCPFYQDEANEVAIAIGENLHELTHLELIGSNMKNTGLQAILDGCRHLETLDLRNCTLIDLNGDIGNRCFKQIKSLKLPNDFLEGSPFGDFYEVDFENLDFNEYILMHQQSMVFDSI